MNMIQNSVLNFPVLFDFLFDFRIVVGLVSCSFVNVLISYHRHLLIISFKEFDIKKMQKLFQH